MRTPAGGRGGSVPPPPPAGKPQQWFVLRPWVFDVTLAGVLLSAAPRPAVPIPVAAWARSYGLARGPGSGRHAISLIGPGPGFNPRYTMTTSLDEPVILATVAAASGELTRLLIDGCHCPLRGGGARELPLSFRPAFGEPEEFVGRYRWRVVLDLPVGEVEPCLP